MQCSGISRYQDATDISKEAVLLKRGSGCLLWVQRMRSHPQSQLRRRGRQRSCGLPIAADQAQVLPEFPYLSPEQAEQAELQCARKPANAAVRKNIVPFQSHLQKAVRRKQ